MPLRRARSRPLCFSDQINDVRHERISIDALGFHDEAAGAINRPDDRVCSFAFSTGSAPRSPSTRRMRIISACIAFAVASKIMAVHASFVWLPRVGEVG
jgi:hypothetical protein